MRCFNGKKPGGFTLAEAMIATVILSIAATGVLLPFVSGASVRAEGVRRTLAAKLASDLMEKIVSDPNMQVDGYSYSEAQGQCKDVSGVVFTDSNYTAFRRNASCVEVKVDQESDDLPPIFILATVRVYYNGREMANITRLISK